MRRKDARDLGLKLFPTEKPCDVCGTSERYVSNGGCVECLRVKGALRPHPRAILAFDSLPADRETAFAMGSKFYKTNQPCVRGHRHKRDTRTGRCVLCSRIDSSKGKYSVEQMKRAGGLVKLELWTTPGGVARLGALNDAIMAERDRVNPAMPPMPLPPSVMPLIPQVPVARAEILPDTAGLRPDPVDRHPDDYQMS